MNPKERPDDWLPSRLDNGSDEYRKMSCLESFGRRFLGFVGYPVLMAAALVEAVVRLALCAIAILPSLLFCGINLDDNIVLLLGYAALLSIPDAPLRCIAGVYYKVILDPVDTSKLRSLERG